jgi:hypothetical protein
MVLLPSPLLGAASWRPVADELVRRGRPVTVASYGRPVAGPSDVLDELLAGVPDEDGLVLVPHSNAGLYVAALAARRSVAAVLFVDAGVPSAEPDTPTAPPGLVRHLAGLAGPDGLLPPWSRWWPRAEVAALFPDEATRLAVQLEERRLPLEYFRSAVPSPAGWERLPAAYLAFGDGYAEERAEAGRRGWPTATLPGTHLHQLADPVAVTDALERLLHTLTRASRRVDPGLAPG